MLTKSYVVGVLVKKIYKHNSTSYLFQKNKEPNALKRWFQQALEELT